MADRRLAVEVTVEGDATRSFKEMGQAAKASAQDMEASSRRAKTGLDQMDKAADSTEQSMRELEAAQKKAAAAADQVSTQSVKAGRAMDQYRTAIASAATGMALIGTSFTMYAGQAREHEVAIMALNRTYGEAAASFLDLADTIQGTTIFSNDEAIAAANVMGTLQRNYGLTTEQIQKLIAASADLASLNGLTLADASQRVAAAIRGEAESAEALGLTMNQAAIDSDNLTLSMTNAEAGAFRYNALIEQSQFAVGAAGDAADTTTGRVKQLTNEFQDAALSVVTFTGPVGEVAAGLGSFGLQAGLAVTGIVQLGRGLTAAAAAAGGFTALMGPAGLIVLGLGAAVAAGTLLARSMRDDVAEAMDSARAAGDDLNATISNLTANMSGTDLTFLDTVVGSDDALDRLQEHLDYWKQLSDTWANFPRDRLEMAENPEWLAAQTDEVRASIKAQQDAVAYMAEYEAAYGSITDGAMALAEAERDLSVILQHQGAARPEILAQLAELNAGYQSGEITIAEYIAALDALEKQRFEMDNDAILNQLAAEDQAVQDATLAWIDYEQASNQAAIATINNAQASDARAEALRREAEAQRLLWDGGMPDDQPTTGLAVDDLARRMAMMPQTADAFTAALIDMIGPARDVSSELVTMVAGVDNVSKSFAMSTPEIEQGTRATEAFVQVLSDGKPELAAIEAAYRELADAVAESMGSINANSVLGDTFGGVVGAAKGFAQLSDSVWEWSNSLTEGNKATSTLNDLNQKGLISDKTYRDGLEANHRIMLANNSVQEDSLRIQAKQLPLMAQLAEEQARYVDGLADRSAEEQIVALGFMDQAKSTQALGLAQLAAASSSAAMQASTSAMIAEIAAADPQLRAMLVSMGLITETPTGITVNFGDVEDGNVAIDNLTAAINSFAAIIAEAFGIDIVLNDAASGPLANILNTLNALDGKTSTVYINTVGGGLTLGAATGTFIVPDAQRNIVANVPGMSTGGHLRLVGEAGPELVSLPSGSTVTNAAGTRGRLDPMGRRRGNQGASVVYKGNVIHQTITVEESTFADRTRRVMGKRRIG